VNAKALAGRTKEWFMHPELRDISDNMRELGLGALTHALRLSLYYTPENPSWPDLSVLNAAHAAEILIKARIAAEHPLLIFSQIPRSTQTKKPLLMFADLFTKGQTIDFADLPERLWATTGIRIPRPEVYAEFGKLRNAIQHFAAGEDDSSGRTLKFVFNVVDPFIHKEWGLYAIDFNEESGDHYEHIFETLVDRKLRPLISPTAAECWRDCGYQPSSDSPASYRTWFHKSMAKALGDAGQHGVAPVGRPRTAARGSTPNR
jgi:hypothetical protein